MTDKPDDIHWIEFTNKYMTQEAAERSVTWKIGRQIGQMSDITVCDDTGAQAMHCDRSGKFEVDWDRIAMMQAIWVKGAPLPEGYEPAYAIAAAIWFARNT